MATTIDGLTLEVGSHYQGRVAIHAWSALVSPGKVRDKLEPLGFSNVKVYEREPKGWPSQVKTFREGGVRYWVEGDFTTDSGKTLTTGDLIEGEFWKVGGQPVSPMGPPAPPGTKYPSGDLPNLGTEPNPVPPIPPRGKRSVGRYIPWGLIAAVASFVILKRGRRG